MSRHIDGGRTQFQDDLQKVMAVQTQDGAPVRMDISDLLQFCRDLLRILQAREQDQAVNFAHFPVFLVDRADLSRDDKTGGHLPRDLTVSDPVLLLQDIESVLCRFQLLRQFLPPCRMGKVSCPDDMDPLSPRPEIKMLRSTVLTRRPGIAGMNM